MFSQILGINDQGLAVGYYGDSTTSQHGYYLSQHGYFYNTNTGTYTFLDDPAAVFHNGVEVTQITGINNAGEITGFYSDANGSLSRLRRDRGARAQFHGSARHRHGLRCGLGSQAPTDDPRQPIN